MNELKLLLQENPRNFDDECELFKKCTVEEYKEMALFALSELSKQGSFIEQRTDNAGWAAHHITKAIFEEQDIFDPYSDNEFLEKAAATCPYYINRYIIQDNFKYIGRGNA